MVLMSELLGSVDHCAVPSSLRNSTFFCKHGFRNTFDQNGGAPQNADLLPYRRIKLLVWAHVDHSFMLILYYAFV